LKFLTIILLILSAIPAMAQVESPSVTDETWKFLTGIKWSKGPQALADIKDPNTRIAIGMRRVLTDEITAQQFYREMATLELNGKELRTKMVEVKTSLLNTLGTEAAQHFFGELYVKDQADLRTGSGGAGETLKMGSQVEDLILTWRDGLYDQIKKSTMERLAQEFAGDNRKYSAFLADLGSRPDGTGRATVAGDLDVNLITAHPDIGPRFLALWDEGVRAATGGLSGVDIDVVATVFGMSGPEVYAGEAGRIKAAEMILDGRVNNVQQVDLETGRLGEQVSGRQALREVAMQGGLDGIEIPETGDVKLPPAGPALIFEMARHLDRDVLRNLQFEDMESFIKVAKFVERASGEAERAGHPIDSELVGFSKDLVEAKGAGDYVRASELIEKYFGNDMPLEVELGRSRDPKAPLTIVANRDFVAQFGEKCFDEIMTTGKDFLGDEIKVMNDRVKQLNGGSGSPKQVAEDLAKLREAMEVEKLILEHPDQGLRTMDPEIVRMVDGLHDTNKSLMRDNWRDVLPDNLKKQRIFVENILSKEGDLNSKLAAATLAHTPADALSKGLEFVDGVNNLLDSLDDRLLGPLRGEVDFMSKIAKGHEVSYATRAGTFLGPKYKMSGGMTSFLSDLEVFNTGIELKLNTFFFDNLLAKQIQKANTTFGNAVNNSTIASAGMKAVAVIQLADELPAYWNAFDQDSLEEGFSQLATTFFERRVPGGSSVKHVMMGNVGLACLDLFTAVFPPTAMVSAAYGLGEAMSRKSIDYYWSSELDLFTDELYASATWEQTGTKRLGDSIDLSQWKLKTVTYNGKQIIIDEYLALKRVQISEMQAAMLVPFKDRNFPYQHVGFDPLMGWYGADELLRKNLARSDNTLLVIDEARKNQHVGWKQDLNLYHRWTLRWERVKVAYLERVIDRLQRRSSTEALGSHRLAEVLLELYAVTEELKISWQVFAALEKEAGFNELGSWMTWFKDVAIAGKRSVLEQAMNETAIGKATRVSLDYLEVYTDIREARRQTEAAFVFDGKPTEESGLRIMTTPWLLAGNANRDKTGYARWANLPVTKAERIVNELAAIKGAFVPGGRLDMADGSFDLGILRGMIYHDVFKEMWKTVQTKSSVIQGSVTNLDFRLWWELSKQNQFGDDAQRHADADAGLASLTGSNEIDGIGSNDIPLARFRHHDAERELLALEFLEHYLTGDGRLAGLVARAEEIATEIEGNCDRAEAEIDAVRTGAETLSAHAVDLTQTLASVETRLEPLAAQLDAISRSHAEAEAAATLIAGAASEVERLSLEICNRLKRAKAATDPEVRQQIMTEMHALNDSIVVEVETADDQLEVVEQAAKDARAAFNDVEGVLEEIRLIEEAAASVADGSDLSDRLTAASDALGENPPLIDELGEIGSDAVEFLGAVADALGRIPESEDTIEVGARVEASVDQVLALVERAEGTDETEACWVTVSDLLEEAAVLLDDARAEVDEANAELTQAVTTIDAFRARVDQARMDTEGTEYLFELAGDYRDRLQTAVDGAGMCLDLAGDLFSQGTVPDVLGRAIDEARGILANAGLQATMQGGTAAPSVDLEYSVESQTPAAGEAFPEGGAVTLRIYGPSGTLRVPAVTGLAAAGARSAIEGAGLVAAFVAGSTAETPEEAFKVEAQDPAAGTQVERGDTVTVRINGAFDVAAATRGVDCSAWAGTAAVWDSASGTAQCECPPPSTWSGADGRCIIGSGAAVAAAPQISDPCADRDAAFWQLLAAQRLDDARDVLLQSQECGFYSNGVGALQNALNQICQQISMQILQACAQGNLAQAQGLIGEATRRRCRVSAEAYQCIERAQRSQRAEKTQQQWNQVFGMVNQLAQQMQQDRSGGNRNSGSGSTWTPPPQPSFIGQSHHESNTAEVVFPGAGPFPGTDPGGGGTSGGGTPAGGGGSQQECERKYCSMCGEVGETIDLIGVSVNSQCNECRSVNAANIKACGEGRAAGPEVATTAVYRLVCNRYREDVEGCNSYSCLDPGDVKGPYDHVVGTYHEWEACYRKSSMYTGYRQY
jgi:hypothetical protein